jgi:hypothetical protein
MLVVKKTIMLLVVVSILQNCYSQRNIIGKYNRIKTESFSEDIGTSYDFRRDGSFTQTNFLHLNSKFVFNGNYRLKKDSLILYYKPNIRTEKGYKFIKKKKLKEENSTSYLFSKIKIINRNLRKSEVEMLIYDKNGKLLMGFSCDENGEFPYLNLFDTKIEYFIFSSLLFQELRIPANELFGFTTEIHILLKKNLIRYSQKKDTIKYFVKSFNKKKIELKNVRTKEKVTIVKQ